MNQTATYRQTTLGCHLCQRLRLHEAEAVSRPLYWEQTSCLCPLWAWLPCVLLCSVRWPLSIAPSWNLFLSANQTQFLFWLIYSWQVWGRHMWVRCLSAVDNKHILINNYHRWGILRKIINSTWSPQYHGRCCLEWPKSPCIQVQKCYFEGNHEAIVWVSLAIGGKYRFDLWKSWDATPITSKQKLQMWFREVLCTRVRVRCVRVKEGSEAVKTAGTFCHGLRGGQGSELSWAELLWDPQMSLHTPLYLTLRIQSRHHVWWIFSVVNFTVPGIS